MSIVTVTASYQNGVSTIEIPEGFDPATIALLMNGQVWAGQNLTVSGNTVTVAVDLSDELIQISDFAGTSVEPDQTVTEQLGTIVTLLESQGASLPVANTVDTATDETSKLTTVVSLSADNATIVQGRSTRTGRRISGLNHLIQSVGIILLTPIGSRVKRRTFGTRLFELTDWPQNDSTRISIIRTVFDAIDKWEPRLELQQVGIQATKDDRKDGKLNIQLSGIYRGNTVTFGVIA